jgi:hypothetical protein
MEELLPAGNGAMSAIIPVSVGFNRSLAHQARAVAHIPAPGRGAPIAMHLVSSPERFQLAATFIVAQLEEKNRAHATPLACASTLTRVSGTERRRYAAGAFGGRMTLIIGPQFRGPEMKSAATTH